MRDTLVWCCVQLGGLVAADPAQLADREVAAAVEGRFLDTAISVREAAMELVGHYVTTDPNLANQVSVVHLGLRDVYVGTLLSLRRAKLPACSQLTCGV